MSDDPGMDFLYYYGPEEAPDDFFDQERLSADPTKSKRINFFVTKVDGHGLELLEKGLAEGTFLEPNLRIRKFGSSATYLLFFHRAFDPTWKHPETGRHSALNLYWNVRHRYALHLRSETIHGLKDFPNPFLNGRVETYLDLRETETRDLQTFKSALWKGKLWEGYGIAPENASDGGSKRSEGQQEVWEALVAKRRAKQDQQIAEIRSLLDAGEPLETVAAQFGVQPASIARRLKRAGGSDV